MEGMNSRSASKPPLHPNFKSSISTLTPLKMKLPSTLSKAFGDYYPNIPSEIGTRADAKADKSVVISPEKGVDLDTLFSSRVNHEGEGMNKTNTDTNSPSINKNCQINQGVESGSSKEGKRVMTLDEAVQIEKDGRDISFEEERKLRRTLSNRLSAQRSRLRSSRYISDLHKKIKVLQENVAVLTPKRDRYKQMQTMLTTQKTVLEQKLKSCIEKSNLCNREFEENKAEIRRLREIICRAQEEQKMMSSAEASAGTSTSSAPPPNPPENNYQIGVCSTSCLFQNEPQPPEVEVSTDEEGIEQYLNLDALTVFFDPPHATNVM